MSREIEVAMTNYPHAKSDAAKMLATGLKAAASGRGLSLREIGRRLGYSQPVVLSHWATGRTPIPIDRAVEIAREVGLPKKQFLLAVLEQRHRDVDWSIVTTAGDEFAIELEDLAGEPLSALNPDQRAVMREIVCDSNPTRRWLSLAEIPVIDTIREVRPLVRTEGLSPRDKRALREALHAAEK
jgi:hypothetical protein